MNPFVSSSDRILRVHNVARLLGCSPRTIRRRIQKRQIIAMRIGRRAWGVRACDLQHTNEGAHGRD